MGHTSGSSTCYPYPGQPRLTGLDLGPARGANLRCPKRSRFLASLCAAESRVRPVRRSSASLRPPKGCRRTRMPVGVFRSFSRCHPLRSAGVTRFQRYYGVIRLLHARRSNLSAGPTIEVDAWRSPGVRHCFFTPSPPPIPGALVWISGFALQGVLTRATRPAQGFTSVRYGVYDPGFHPTRPRGFALRYLRVRAAALHGRFPPAGSKGTFTPRISAMPGAPWRCPASPTSALLALDLETNPSSTD